MISLPDYKDLIVLIHNSLFDFLAKHIKQKIIIAMKTFSTCQCFELLNIVGAALLDKLENFSKATE